MTRSRRRLRRATCAAVLAAPLLATTAVPAAATAARPVDWYGSYGAYGAYGTYGAYGPEAGAWSGREMTTAQTTTQDATTATKAQSAGVVLIDTVVDYGEAEAAGTGLVLRPNGTVVTNHHVIAGATSITVTVPTSGKTYTARVIGYDTSADVAVLRLTGASGLRTVRTDTATRVREAVSAVGNAEGRNRLTAAAGRILRRRTAITVSEDDGSTAHLKQLIEDSSDVVPGDSGGALLDARDRVVGMTVAASSGSSTVTGYAIPIGRVLTIAHEILAGEASSAVTIGTKAALGVELDSRSTAPYVAAVMPDSAASRAGLTAGDTITGLDGTDIGSYADLSRVLAGLKPGDKVAITWTDVEGGDRSATITLGTAPIS